MTNAVKTCVLILCLLSAADSASAREETFPVKYISAEFVYVDGGAAEGLSVGDTLTLRHSAGCNSTVTVTFVSEHSASCQIVSDSCHIAVGDRFQLSYSVRAHLPRIVDTVGGAVAVDTATPAVPKPRRYSPRPLPRISGSASVLYYSWNDNGPSNLDFRQTTARLNFKARRLFSSDITFGLRLRGRYDQRQRSYSSVVPQHAWENRVWEMSLSYDAPTAGFTYSAGRILPRRISTAGYLDGLAIERRMGAHTRLGALAGAQPRWAYDHGAVSLQKGGAYMTYISGQPGLAYMEQTVGVLGEYHAGTVNRELISIQGRLDKGTRAGFSHAVDIDINRSWRKERARKSFELSSTYLTLWYRLSPRLRATISYDNRVNYWTYETRSTLDSLFDDKLRQGVRGQLDATLPMGLQTSLGWGLRKREGDPDGTVSYSLTVMKAHLWRPTSNGFLQYASFNGPNETGYNYSVRLSDYLNQKVLAGLAYGAYRYKADAELNHRTTTWYELTLQADLSRRYFVMCAGQLNSGDDIDGLRLQTELGWRF